ncbi:hypothetical protein [Bacillus tuaregi]|nr:hypothetical protein [Bacillus tuaregi]
MKPEEPLYEDGGLMEDPILAPNESNPSAKESSESGFKLWWDGWD